MLATQATTTKAERLESSHSPPTNIVSDKGALNVGRRESTTSESSLEHLDLGRTPKKLNTHTTATSTPHITNGVGVSATSSGRAELSTIAETEGDPQQKSTTKVSQQDSDEANDYDDDESADERLSTSARSQRHHKRRSTGRPEKRTTVQLELNADNPHSLRKKFRFNRSHSEVTGASNNESGFVDASCSSQYLNASTMALPATHNSCSNSNAIASNSSSASSSPHGAGISGSSPESGIAEREDMKYVCPICEVVSATPHEFTNHIRCHNYASGVTENFTCRICSKVLSSASSLDRHVLVHTGERPFNCKYCHLTFTTNGNMHRHMRTHKQHQHNHHHRRNSNGTKNNNNASNGNGASAANTANGQLNYGGMLLEGVKSASRETAATTTTAITTTTVTTTTTATPHISTALLAASTAVAVTPLPAIPTATNGIRLNGTTTGIESYESDGGCSTDSSSAISQSSNNQHTNNSNYNSMKSNNNNNNNNNDNNTNNNNSNLNNFKRKNSDQLDADNEITLMKRRIKTTINNNSIIANNVENQLMDNGIVASPLPASAEQQPVLACPVCHLDDFNSMLALGAHLDNDHPDIPAKCRQCDVVFRTHHQLNVHPCTHTHKLRVAHGFNFDFSDEKYPLIAKSMCEQSLRVTNSYPQSYRCAKCSRAFPCDTTLKMHSHVCGERVGALNHLPRFKRRSLSESSAGAEDHGDDDQQRRDEFFRQLYLKNSSLRSQSLNSLASSHASNDASDNPKCSAETGERVSQRLLSHQSADSKDGLADIQSILNMTSPSSTSNFLKNFEQSVNTSCSSYSPDKDEEEAQDAFTSEFRKMKLRGEFPCKLCTAVFPNLRALKGHNRIHLGAVGPAGPFRCNMCPYSDCDKAALVRHMRSHNGDRPYECALCKFAFTTKANCERHLRNLHRKTTRDEVKRAIIYHPSEDSSCDDAGKKTHMFSSPDFDDDIDLPYQHPKPKDRSTPVSHLKEMLSSESVSFSKPIKIQVKSLEQLLDKATASNSYSEAYDGRQSPVDCAAPESAPMDLSMDVLDLSKKPSNRPVEKRLEPPSRPATPPASQLPDAVSGPASTMEEPKFDFFNLEKNQQLAQQFLAQQQLMNEALPKLVDPAQYFQQLYRNLMLPSLNPFFLQNSFLPNSLSDLQKFAPLMNMFAGATATTNSQLSTGDANKPHPNASSNAVPVTMLPQVSPLMTDKSHTSALSPPSAAQMLPKSLASPTPSNTSLNIPRHPHMPSTVLPGGPVKMVIKNGVLMPKQKQRRYRTERPFACEHCSARFTLRSNMERHVKQQHPQFYAQRQRSGHHVMRGRGASSAANMNGITHLQAAFAQAHSNSGSSMTSSPISDQVKYAILAQQLKARKDTDLLQQALSHGSSSVAHNHMMLAANASGAGLTGLPNGQQFSFNHLASPSLNINGSMEDDEPKLIIDEDDDDNDVEEIPDDEEEEIEQKSELNDSLSTEPLTKMVEVVKPQTSESNIAAKKVAETILEQAIKASQTSTSPAAIVKPEDPSRTPTASTMKSMIAQAESVGKFLKEVASSPFKDESQDLVPVAKLVDNATSNSVSFNNYFRPSDVANHMEQSDEEGLVASGSASESNNSGTEDIATSAEPKKKSAYSLAPNRVSCPYCQRMFPWSSSLRRHILTHTGQKPFKCSHCPLLFTTKSNCDRHLLRKHGNVESAVSVYVPTEDVTEPIPVPKSVEEIEQQQRQREEEERRRKSDEAARQERERREKEQQQQQQLEHEQQLLKQLTVAQFNQLSAAAGSSPKTEANTITSTSELPFKCHLCESSFGERIQCLEHIKIQHAHEFALLLAKGAIDNDAEANQLNCNTEEDERRLSEEGAPGTRGTGGGRYPDYSNRKVICAFCIRRFWSTEDLRRHMRTHSGERPFQCEICMRKFTLKHSMLRHMKKHADRQLNGIASGDASLAGNSGSDFSDDEQAPPPNANTNASNLNSRASFAPKIQELLTKANEWRTNHHRLSTSLEHKENIGEEHNNPSDLIGNLLGISDQGILNKLLSSADEAAKLLGVDK